MASSFFLAGRGALPRSRFWVVVCPTSSSTRCRLLTPALRQEGARSLSSSSTTTTTSSSQPPHNQTGTVKFFLRNKGFGFIQPDGGAATDVFVHRLGIHCQPPVPADQLAKSPRWPYLKKGERVRYAVRPNAAGLDQAVQVVWLNGTPIPPERTNYLGGVHERAKRLLGEAVFDLILTRQPPPTDQEILQELRAQMEMAQTTIRNAENFVRRLGMDPADFPTVKAATGRGRYQFSNDPQAAEGSGEVEDEHEDHEEEEEHQEEQQPPPAVAPESEEGKEHAAATAAAIPTEPVK